MKILVIVLSGIGDALMFTPSLEKLKEKFPSSTIDALVMFKGVEDIFSRLPEISSVHYWDFLHQKKFASLKFVHTLRKQYDATINVYPSNRKEYNLISFLIGAPKRAAVKYLRMDFANFGWLNNLRIDENDSQHNIEENIKLTELITGEKYDSIPPMKIVLDEKDNRFAEQFLKSQNITNNDLVVGFHPGCAVLKNHDKRRWETEKFSALAKKVINEKNAKVLLFGGPEEKHLRSEIIDKTNSDYCIEVKTENFLQTAAVIKRCNLFVTNDSALMHTASALKLKIAAIIGPTNTNYIHPWQTDYRIASLNLECSPCFYYSPKPLTCTRTDVKFKCIKELEVDLVYSKVLELLGGSISVSK